MRVDKFINSTNIVKKRSLAQDMCHNGVVLVNGVVSKSSKEVKIGDIIELKYLEESKKYKVLAIPLTKSIPKSKSQDYVIQLT